MRCVLRFPLRTAVVLFGLAMLLACTPPRPDRAVLLVHGRPVTVEVARTERERRRGLMFRKELKGVDGMLFVFDEENYYGFWMKNTYLPLEIAFFNADGKVVDVDSMAPRDTALHCSLARCRYALELPLGSFERFHIKIGDTIVFHPSLPK